jgi:hypothetical protein
MAMSREEQLVFIRNTLEELRAKLAANPKYQLNPVERNLLQQGLLVGQQVRGKRPPLAVRRAAKRLGLNVTPR